MEIIVAIFIVLWVVLFYVGRAAGKAGIYGGYAWLAYAARPLLLSVGFGLFLIFVGTDWHNPFWERLAGFTFVLAGVGLFVRAVLRRKEIQERLASGRIKPTDTDG